MTLQERLRRIDKKNELLQNYYTEMERRQGIEDEACRLTREGRGKEAIELLDSLDDSIPAAILYEITAIDSQKQTSCS